MGATFVLDEKDCSSKVTSGMLGAIFYSIFGKKNPEIDGWKVNQEDMAKVVLTIASLKNKKEVFQAFMEMFPDAYWVHRIKEDPLFYKDRPNEIYQMCADKLAEMVINKTDYIYAAWEW